MSDNVKSPFLNKSFGVHDKVYADNFLSEIPRLITTGRDLVKSLKPQVTAEDQKVRAGYWFKVLQTFMSRPNMTGPELHAQYSSSFPVKSRSTKKGIQKAMQGSRESIINYLIKTINNDLNTGGMPPMSKDQILSTMGVKKVPVTIGEAMTGKKAIPTSPKSAISLPLPDKNLPLQDKRFDVVRPLRSTMEMALKTKGVSPSQNIEVLTNQFYNDIVRVDQPNNFTGQVELPAINLYDCTPSHADEATDAIITAVVTYVKGLRDRKASGGELSKVQDIIVTGTERSEGIIKTKAKEEAAQRVGSEILFGGKWAYIIGGVIAFIVIVVLLARKR